MRTLPLSCVRVALLPALLAGFTVGCVDPDSPLIQQSAEGCDEIESSATIESVEVDESVRRLMSAAADFSAVVSQAEGDVFEACAGIATDLGAGDTWSAIEDRSAKISNDDGTGACDQAALKLEAALPASAEINVAIEYQKGYCYVEYERQVECDQECTSETTCEPGPVEERCEPGSLAVKCEQECAAQATCLGSGSITANCEGSCQGECKGACEGTCVAADGSRTENDANCAGKCVGSCSGSCSGECKIEIAEGCNCGANVYCKGGCTSTYTEPVCVTEYGPPVCTVDETCHEVCTAHCWANPVCVPTTVDVVVDSNAEAELATIEATLEAHLPALIEAAEVRGEAAVDALERLSDAGSELETRSDEFTGKSVACATESGAVVARDLKTIRVTVDASVRVVKLCRERAM